MKCSIYQEDALSPLMFFMVQNPPQSDHLKEWLWQLVRKQSNRQVSFDRQRFMNFELYK